MTTKKTVIFFSGYLKKRGGGPSSYLFNLCKGLENNADGAMVRFISRGISENSEALKARESFNKVAAFSAWAAALSFFLYNKIKYSEFWKNKKEIKSADILHFHNVLDCIFLKKAAGKNCIKILTVHTPESIANEIPKDNFKAKILGKMRETEMAAFEWANVYLYPCQGALDAHLEIFPYLSDNIKKKKVVFCPTGTEKLEILESREKIREKFGIPQDAFVISFTGRHIKVKGFDLLANSVSEISKTGKKIYLLTAGKGELVEYFKNNSVLSGIWHHIDWTEAPGDIINASDCFVLANRTAFFDLALLEALSVGVPIITTNVGGSTFVIGKSRGIIPAKPEIGDITEKISGVIKMSQAERSELGRQNIFSFQQNFTIEAFAKNYIKALKNL